MKDYTIEHVVESGELFYIFYDKKKNKKIYLNSTYSSEKEAEKFLGEINSDQLNIIIGIGNGTLIKKIRNSNFIQCLIIEPFEEVKIDEEAEEIINSRKNISFYYSKNITPIIFNEYIRRFLGLNTNILIHPRYEKTSKKILNETLEIIKNGTIMSRINKNTERFFKKDWIIEPLLNLEYTLSAPSIRELSNKFVGETALLVASGPSLAEKIPFIKKVKDKAFIFSVGSALNGLLSNDVVPDYVTAIDSGIKNYTTHFKGVNYNGPLILSGMLNSNILKNHKGVSILSNLNIDPITPLYRKEVPSFPSVPSVAVFTLNILYYLGFSRVYLIGQDLALQNGNYYAKGIKLHSNSNNHHPDLYIESNNGKQVGTLFSLYSHLQSFNNLVELIDQEKMKIYNLSENGAKIKGIDYISTDSIELINNKKTIRHDLIINSEENVSVLKKIILEINSTQKIVADLQKKLGKINTKAITLKDLSIVLKIFKELRKQKIIEDIFLKQLSFYVQKLNNKFEYTFEKEIITNKDRLEMVQDIIKLVNEIHNYLEEVLSDERIKGYLSH